MRKSRVRGMVTNSAPAFLKLSSHSCSSSRGDESSNTDSSRVVGMRERDQESHHLRLSFPRPLASSQRSDERHREPAGGSAIPAVLKKKRFQRLIKVHLYQHTAEPKTEAQRSHPPFALKKQPAKHGAER
jgi:hypothetical protein